MNAPLFLRDIFGQFWTHAAGCWALPWDAWECQSFWNWVAIGSIAAGALALLAANTKNIRNFFKNRASPANQNEAAQAWDGVERRNSRSERRIAREKRMKQFAWAGRAEIREELDRRMSDRRKFDPDKTNSRGLRFDPDKTNPRGLRYDQIRDRLDQQDAPTLPPWASKKDPDSG